jgi:hypothetical protein
VECEEAVARILSTGGRYCSKAMKGWDKGWDIRDAEPYKLSADMLSPSQQYRWIMDAAWTCQAELTRD